jgi:hypothetical protein
MSEDMDVMMAAMANMAWASTAIIGTTPSETAYLFCSL